MGRIKVVLRWRAIAVGFGSSLFLAPALLAQGPSALPIVPIDTFSLENGLRVIVSEDDSAPIVAVSLWYHVGSAHEGPGRTGWVHLFEHVLHEGVGGLGPGDADRLITEAGGVYGMETTADRVAFTQVVPVGQLGRALWIQREHMAGGGGVEAALAAHRVVAARERQARIAGRPFETARTTVDTLAQAYEPYRHSVLGRPEDLLGVDGTEVASFHERSFVPSNAVLALVGDVRAGEARPLVEEHFGGIRRSPPAPALPAPTAATGYGARRATVDDPLAPSPLVWMAFDVPPGGHPDRFALRLLAHVLATGESSRLTHRLAGERSGPSSVAASLDLRVRSGRFEIVASPPAGTTPARLETIIQEEVEVLQSQAPTPEETDRALRRQRMELIAQRMTVESKAGALQWHTLHSGSPFSLNEELARYEGVTAEDLSRVARAYLDPRRLTVVISDRARPGR